MNKIHCLIFVNDFTCYKNVVNRTWSIAENQYHGEVFHPMIELLQTGPSHLFTKI